MLSRHVFGAGGCVFSSIIGEEVQAGALPHVVRVKQTSAWFLVVFRSIRPIPNVKHFLPIPRLQQSIAGRSLRVALDRQIRVVPSKPIAHHMSPRCVAFGTTIAASDRATIAK